MNRRAFVIALVVTVIGVFLLALYQRRFETEASGGEKVKLLIAVKPIERGSVIVDDMIATREVPLAYVEDRAIKEFERPKIVGLRVGNLVQAQQTLMWTDLASNEEQRDLSGLIQPGSRAVSIHTSRDDSNAALIRPGDYVDVISVVPETAKTGEQEHMTSVVLMQRVLVLASGLSVSPQESVDPTLGGARYADNTLLTLSVTLPEAQVLALAAEKGRLAVVLRPPNDQRVTSQVTEYSTRQLLEARERANMAKGGRVTPIGPTNITTETNR
ncbi:Flp pilus assembly protein CpaB [Pendulispora albinea]|uniref:Flp pilus assembly protein CpaB n=1 Tax=Pendulispora albinea TaxID=2741071 RepID=A0ABZ2LQR4_9BACT